MTFPSMRCNEKSGEVAKLSSRSVGQDELGLECLLGGDDAVEANNEAATFVTVNDDEAVIPGSDDVGEVINVDEFL